MKIDMLRARALARFNARIFSPTSLCGSYAFGLFSDTLKTDLGFSQGSIDVIASVGELGLWSTFLVGENLDT